jgi:hypothetical protein
VMIQIINIHIIYIYLVHIIYLYIYILMNRNMIRWMNGLSDCHSNEWWTLIDDHCHSHLNHIDL